jgi:predicted nuclease with RNAse H fold
VSENIIVGIDLAGKATKPTGWAVLEDRHVLTRHLYATEEILTYTISSSPNLVAIDAPLALPKSGAMREADKQMHKLGYPVFPPRFPAMRALTIRAVEITKRLKEEKINVIEVHPASTRKALGMPSKDWSQIQENLRQMGLKGDLENRVLSHHEIDAVTAALTAYLHMKGKTSLVGEQKEGYIVVPVKSDWKRLRL